MERGNEQTEREGGNEDSTLQRDPGKALLKPERRRRPEAEPTKAALGCKRSAWVPKESDTLEGSLMGDEDPTIPTSTAVAKTGCQGESRQIKNGFLSKKYVKYERNVAKLSSFEWTSSWSTNKFSSLRMI